MQFMLIVCAALAVGLPTHAATLTAPTKEPTSIKVKTANDLADSCAVTPSSNISFVRLNFCTGFAQGILQTNAQNSDGTKICLPNPAPRRSETMKEFATWVRADPSRRVGERRAERFSSPQSPRLTFYAGASVR
jgi:hypothetical protein